MEGILQGKTAVITGAASGIGRATAECFAKEGSALALLDIDAKGLAAVEKDLSGTGRDVLVVPTDVTDPSSVTKARDTVLDRYGSVDIVVNSAGVELPGTIFTTTKETWDKTLGINVTGSFLVSQAFIEGMKTRRRGSIVNIGSSASQIAIADLLVYCVSKGAVAQLTRGIAVEAGQYGIRANCVHPGFTNTPMGNAGASHAGIPVEEFQTRAAKKYPMGRIAQPDEIAAAILFLASDKASFITGAQLSVDGGLVSKQPLA